MEPFKSVVKKCHAPDSHFIPALYTPEPCKFSRVPNLQDIRTTTKLLSLSVGAKVDVALDSNRVTVDAKNITQFEALYDLVRTMRASVVILGPLLARFGQARVSLPRWMRNRSATD